MAYGFESLINKFVLGSVGDSVSPSTLTVVRIQKSFIQDICSQSQCHSQILQTSLRGKTGWNWLKSICFHGHFKFVQFWYHSSREVSCKTHVNWQWCVYIYIYRKSLRISEAHAALPPRKYILYECKWLPTISWHLPWDSVKYSSFTVEIDGDTSLTKSLQEKKICLMLDSEETEAMRDSPYTHVGLTWLRDPLPTGV